MNTSLDGFEQRLLAELKHVVAAQPRPELNPRPVRNPKPARRRAKLVVAAGLSAGLAGGLALNMPGGSPTQAQPAQARLAADFLDRAAAAALTVNVKQPAPGQVYYIRQRHLFQLGNNYTSRGCVMFWNLTPLTGKIHPVMFGDRSGCPDGAPQPPADLLPANVKHGAPLPEYPPLSSLPARPSALLAALRAVVGPHGPYAYLGGPGSSRDEMVYQLIGNLLEAPIPGTLRAALYQAISTLPGVSLVNNAVDAAGRRGIGIELKTRQLAGLPMTFEFILRPGTYDFLGQITVGYSYQGQGKRPLYYLQSTADLSSGLETLAKH